MKKLLLICLLCMGCERSPASIEEAHQREFEYDKNSMLSSIHNKLIFYKDSVTGVCFAGVSHTFTYVPCSPEIDRIAVPFNSTRK